MNAPEWCGDPSCCMKPIRGLRATWQESYSQKFDAPFTAFLHSVSLDGCDDVVGDVESAIGWNGRMGRRILTEDSQGFVSSERFATVADALEAMEALAFEEATGWEVDAEDSERIYPGGLL